MKARIVFTEAQKKAMRIEMKRQLDELGTDEANMLDALYLLTLHEKAGYGKRRLRKFYESFNEIAEELKEYYCCEPINTYEGQQSIKYYATERLKKIGVDVERWNKERDTWNEENDDVWNNVK